MAGCIGAVMAAVCVVSKAGSMTLLSHLRCKYNDHLFISFRPSQLAFRCANPFSGNAADTIRSCLKSRQHSWCQ
eukprot:scaffold235362_cov28-Prasinocladus_malaysianus.AAC.1